MNPIIEVKNIGKRYKITHERGRYVALRDVLTAIIRKPFAYMKQKAKSVAGLSKKEDFWALKDINFTINKGEVVGIIGRNGAGKSTLLKILSQITPPTDGEIIMRGSVGSLLEVGTGFHPELTGRENIFLNGAILGMGRKEIAKKFDQIVDFAGIAKFLDTPVKYYSSGMYVRLAFSVAAHMEPDILLVDEVLAVGDAEFQKKCLGKMEEVTRKDGRTIIFVSHNLDAIEKLCKKTILLKNGQIEAIGETAGIIKRYLSENEIDSKIPLRERPSHGAGKVIFTGCELLGNTPENGSLKIKISYENTTSHAYENARISLSIKNAEGMHLSNMTNSVLDQRIDFWPGKGDIVLEIKNFNLESGEYWIDLFMSTDDVNSEILSWMADAALVKINNDTFYRTEKLPPVPCKMFFDFTFQNVKPTETTQK